MDVKIEKGNLVVSIPLLKEPTLSSTGKTLAVATTHGNIPTEAKVDGKTVIIGLNAYIKAEPKTEPKNGKDK